MQNNNHVSWLEISSQAIKHNLNQVRKVIDKKTIVMPIIKANAYGHGFFEVVSILKKLKIKWLGVASLEEALELRRLNYKGRVLVLSFYNPNLLEDAIENKITLTVYGYGAAKQLNKLSKKLKIKTSIHFKIDTGTSRLGLSPDKAITEILNIKSLSNLKLEGIFSHLADAENTNQIFSRKQNLAFDYVAKELQRKGVEIPLKHLACSASTFLNKSTHKDMIRYGISLYGLWSIEEKKFRQRYINKNITLKPVLSWYTRVLQVKEIKKNSNIGYGQSYKTKKKTKIAIIPVGYYDGYDRKLSNNAQVLINGKRCSVIGRVCMNLTIIDVSKIPSIKPGDIVILIGKNKGEYISVDDLAKRIGTINYEVTTRINNNIPRLIIN
ncbi:MAG: alanine racemase [Candidatus Kerfeldbacteria bacterium]